MCWYRDRAPIPAHGSKGEGLRSDVRAHLRLRGMRSRARVGRRVSVAPPQRAELVPDEKKSVGPAWINEILDQATREVRSWPKWMQSPEHRHQGTSADVPTVPTDPSDLPPEDPKHRCGPGCDGQDGRDSECARRRESARFWAALEKNSQELRLLPKSRGGEGEGVCCPYCEGLGFVAPDDKAHPLVRLLRRR